MARLRTFYLQYISLMLIVITFVIGSFVTHATSKPAALPLPQISIKALKTASLKQISSFSFDDLFEDKSSVLKAEKLGALKELLLNHDLSSKIWIKANDAKLDADSRVALALARSVSVYKFLREQGVPDAALSVVASQAGGPQFSAEIMREEIQ